MQIAESQKLYLLTRPRSATLAEKSAIFCDFLARICGCRPSLHKSGGFIHLDRHAENLNMTTGSDQLREEGADNCAVLDCGYPPKRTDSSRSESCTRCGGLTCLTEAISDGGLPFLVAEAILPDLTATTKEEAIRELLRCLAGSGAIDVGELESTTNAILRREELGSTAIGHGVAIPHISHPSVCQTVGAAARSRNGVDFDSGDGQPVHLIFLLLSPPNKPGDHLRALGAVAEHLRVRGVSAA